MLFVKAEDTETSLTCAMQYVDGRGVWISRTGAGGIDSYPRPAFVTVVTRDTGSYHNQIAGFMLVVG